MTDLDASRADAVRNRGAILDAAVDVLAVDPSASLSEVARKAGVGRATLYRHFESREALLLAIRKEALARAETALAAVDLTRGTAREAVRQAAAVLVPLGMRFRVLLAEGADTDPGFVAARDRVLQPLGDALARGAHDGEIDPKVSPAWAGMVLAGVLMAAVRAADAGVVGVEAAADLVARTMFDGLTPQ